MFHGIYKKSKKMSNKGFCQGKLLKSQKYCGVHGGLGIPWTREKDRASPQRTREAAIQGKNKERFRKSRKT